MKVGAEVILPDGRTGTVRAVVKTRDCGCTTVFVQTLRGEWAGSASELRVRRR